MRTFILPNTQLQPELDYHAFSQCANENCGNFYDFIPRDGSRLAISFGDLPPTQENSSISISCMQALVRGVTNGSRGDVSELAAELNRTLYLLGSQQQCAPWFYALLDPVRHEMRYVNAGHDAPVLIRSRGEVVRLERTGAMLGLSVRDSHRQKTAAIEPGDVLGIFSGGLAEDDVIRVVRRNPGASSTELTLRVWEETRWWPGEDRTFAAVRVVGAYRAPLRHIFAEEVKAMCAA